MQELDHELQALRVLSGHATGENPTALEKLATEFLPGPAQDLVRRFEQCSLPEAQVDGVAGHLGRRVGEDLQQETREVVARDALHRRGVHRLPLSTR